ncbi:MAG: protein-L-isoaspartate(D-aspartate) O-methyltransferase [Candidatus Margulisiibacteriota bacterium]|nr:protein-L-isoaspartate(D-aspartate) O-methyltransferase [Candidatus Margulisiibacteriota bacterium]
MDYTRQRELMVESQLIPRGITDPLVLKAFNRVPREKFIPEHLQASAYEDCALPIGQGQTISQPYMVAIMTQELNLRGGETILEIGTGSGYQAAILAEIGGKVITAERIESLSKNAEELIKKIGYKNIEFIVTDGTGGYKEFSPYDRVIVTAACPAIPPPLLAQLKEGGRIVLPIGGQHQQILTTITKKEDKLISHGTVPCVFVPLVGKFGFPV